MEVQNEFLQYYRLQKMQLKRLHDVLKSNRIVDEDFFENPPTTNLSIRRIVQLIEDIFEASVLKANRNKNTIYARKACAYILKKSTKLSLHEIAMYIGVTDHTTALYHIRTAKDYILTNDWFKDKIQLIEGEIKTYDIFVEKK